MNIIVFSAMVIILLSASVADIKTQTVSDLHSALLGALGIVSLFIPGTPVITSRLLGLAAVSAPLLLISVLTNGFGGADIKLFAACGLILGVRGVLLAFFIAIILAALFGIVYISLKRQKLKTRIPFVPFIFVGVAASVLLGDKLINLYLGLF